MAENIEKTDELKWVKLILNDIPLSILTKVAPTKGNITYEYNPFYNYRILQNMYEYEGNLYTLADLWNNFKITLKCRIEVNKDGSDTNKVYSISVNDRLTTEDYEKTAEVIVNAFKRSIDRYNLEKALKETGNTITEWWSPEIDMSSTSTPVLREAGELTDFITDELSFDLEHPVLMLPLYSYDGSVNLILNDGKNTPKLINSRFSATGKNTYEVCDRKGNNDTNIYDLGESFDLDTRLYKSTSNIVNIDFRGVLYGGALKIGNYHFYFKLSDADGNESDFIGESGLVSVFLGSSQYSSVSTGERDENSNKLVYFLLSNIDDSYDYIHVYYSRYTAENNLNRTTEYIKINKNYLINNSRISNIYITGFELTELISAEDINLLYNVVDSAYTSAICLNMLFMANVHKPDIPYVELLDLSLRILPYLHTEEYPALLDHNYSLLTTEKGYIDPKFIYHKTGYWTEELYRFGIVYIMPDNTLSPVFNIRGGCNIPELFEDDKTYTNFPVYKTENSQKTEERVYIPINEENYLIINSGFDYSKGECLYENSKGVVSFKSAKDTNIINSVRMIIPLDVKTELLKYVKGYFFVRLPRIPFILALGITIGINKESNTPTIPVLSDEGVAREVLLGDLSKTHICVSGAEELSKNGQQREVVYTSEGFLSRYIFEFRTSSSSLWKKIGKITGIVAAVVGIAVASVFTFGGAAAVTAALATIGGAVAPVAAMTTAGVASLVTVGGTMISAALAGTIVLGSTIALSAAIPAIIAGSLELVGAIQRIGSKTSNRWNTEVPSGMRIAEVPESRLLTQDFSKRVIFTSSQENDIAGILCPDFELDLPHFNTQFVGDLHLIKSTISLGINIRNKLGENYFSNEYRHYYIPEYIDNTDYRMLTTEIVGLSDDLKLGCIKDMRFKARAGEAEEVFRIESVGSSYKSAETKNSNVDDETTTDHRRINSDIIRGSFGPYLAFYDKNNTFGAAETVNIYIAGYDPSLLESYVYQRACDASVFSAISDRFELKLDTNNKFIIGNSQTGNIEHIIYRGDCYLCLFTHRVNRNFQDSSALFNDTIVEEKTWKDNYDPGDMSKIEEINRADVNAILMGMWVTFRVRSSYNLNIRTLDSSNVEEYSMTNTPRTYYPKSPMSVDGIHKIPESSMLNSGFKKGLSERYNFEVPDVPWIKNWFGTRIMYSNINVSDSFLNGFRIFKGLNYRDYTREYGSITKIISLESSLLCIFEHGVALIPVNERAVASLGVGGLAYINTSNVLPENPKILSDVFGSQWSDSILKVPGKFGDNVLYVYGVDTVAKKIWRTDGNTLTCISDFKVLEFLNNNISLSQNELTPKLGIRNVKTVYNSFKRDVLFTFYDNTYGFEEKVWNLCWNELLLLFTTFYSWVPSYMENINNIPFSFNRNTLKWIAKLGASHTNNSFSDGVTLSNVIISNIPDAKGGYTTNYKVPITYKTVDGSEATIVCEVADDSKKNLVGVLSLSNRTIPDINLLPLITFTKERDVWGNYKLFRIDKVKLTLPDTPSLINNDGNLILPNSNTKYSKALFGGLSIITYGLFLTEEAKKVKLDSNLKIVNASNSPTALMSELYYRNAAGNVYADSNEANKLSVSEYGSKLFYFEDCISNKYPIWKNAKGVRETLSYNDLVNRNKIVTLLNIKAIISYVTPPGINEVSLSEALYNLKASITPGSKLIDAGYYESVVAVVPKWNMLFLSTDFWRHGLAGIFDITDKILPTNWYGELHPFEFEFIVANDPGKYKIFDNLLIISNKAEPESFHYEIVGECYEFAKDKKNMYIRQEATKELYLHNGSDIMYDHNYTDLVESRRDVNYREELNPNELSSSRIYDKSTLFPLYYGRLDTVNEIYDSYCRKNGEIDLKDFSALSGAELVLYRNLDELRIWNHCKGVNMLDHTKGILRGNMRYTEDLWDIQINPINYILKNEENWDKDTLISGSDKKIPVEINTFAIPDDIKSIENLEIPKSNSFKDRGITDWGDNNMLQEVKIKDKYLKVRIRYSGKDLAIINAINTLYSISYV